MATTAMALTAAAYLKHHTAEAHEALEAVVVSRLQALQTQTAYCRLLQQFWGYFKPVQDRIAQQLDETDVPDLAARRHAGLILQDLHFSNAHTDTLPLATQLPELKSKSAAFGALYVLEGSTLGGRGITRMLLQNTALQLHQNQVHFFNGYGAETGRMWLTFLDRLNTQGANEAARLQMCAAATETFHLFKTWLLTNS